MSEKIKSTIKTAIILTLTFTLAKYLIYGYETHYIADYQPQVALEIGGKLIEGEKSYEPFETLALKTAALRLIPFIIVDIVFAIIYTKKMFEKKIYTSKKDVLYTIGICIIPIVICAFLIYNQLDFTC